MIQHSYISLPLSQQVHSWIPITYFTPHGQCLVTISFSLELESVSWFVSVSLSVFSPFVHCLISPFAHFIHSTYEWNHMIFVFNWLISLSIILSGSIHVIANIHLSFDGYLGCFHLLVIMNNAAVCLILLWDPSLNYI